jgi:hypothetical protein
MKIAKSNAHRSWILGFAIACLLVWQAVGASHFHADCEDYQRCEICATIGTSQALDLPPKLAVLLIPLLLCLICLLEGTDFPPIVRPTMRANLSRAPPAL